MRKAVFPGSFDPITKGHVNLVERAAKLFDEVIVAIGQNTSKKNQFDLETRLAWIEDCFANLENVSSAVYSGLTLDFCKKSKAQFIIRGVRNTVDFEYEKSIAHMNQGMNPEIETVILFTDPGHGHIHSSIVREILKNGGDTSKFLPESVRKGLDK